MLLRKFTTNPSGQVTAVFAFCLIPICAVAGLCLDLQTQMQREVKTQAVLDLAVLAASKVMQTGASDEEIKETVADFVSFHIDSLPGLSCTTPTVTLPSDDASIEASLDCTQDTTLMHIVGRETLPVKVESVSTYSLTSIDIAFMFDLSSSMNRQNRLVDLKSATTDALDILLPRTATTDITENTRIAMVSYGSSLNAGSFFEQVTGLAPTRTYTDISIAEFDDSDIDHGLSYSEIDVYLYDADSSDRIAEIGDGALIKIDSDQLDNMTIVVEPRASHYLFADFESFHFRLSGTETKNATENVEPFALYGDSGMANLNGEQWSTGAYELELVGYDGNSLTGTRILDKTIAFELFKEGDVQESEESYELTSTCVWEREGGEQFTDAPPAAGDYLAAESAWFHQFSPDSPDGEWRVGYNENGERERSVVSCPNATPVELTNHRDTLDNYVSRLSAKGYTAGHLGIAWTWYLISDRWDTVFDDTATPAAFTDPDVKKAVVLMTDGVFNAAGYLGEGDSATQARTLCTEMKDKGIIVYAVAFRAPLDGQKVLRDCASNASSTYFSANNRSGLKAVYKEIAVQLSDLRLSE